MKAIYIKHTADDDSLTHYGVKGMKWHKHKRRFLPGYDEEMTRELQDAAQKRNMERDAHRKDGGIKSSLGQVGLTVRAEAKKRQTTSYKVSSTLKRAGSSTIRASKKAVSKGKSIFNSIRTFKKKHPIITHETTITSYGPGKTTKYVDNDFTRSIRSANFKLKTAGRIRSAETKAYGSNPLIKRGNKRTGIRGTKRYGRTR